MDYVILNGVKSNTVKGLLISELPPISKPLMRTQIEQIDGRDGDIVTPLGYSAYDREMQIGLRAGYDIDAVIEYFNSSGTVVFSNEPDKYYNYTIVEQIDFEKLLRFRTASVTFHVQPFKYSAVGDDVKVSPNRYNGLPDSNNVKNGITVNSTGGNITISGTGASGYTEFYIPVNPVTLAAGSYALNLTASGTGASACAVRLIGSAPTNADSFGGNYATLQDGTVSLTDTLTASKTFNYLWFYIAPGTALDFTLDMSLLDTGVSSATLINLGNTISRPTIQVCGSGDIVLSINGNQVLALQLGENQNIIIDAAEMNAYYNGVFLNRSVTGDYSDVVLNPGTNMLSWDGTIQTLEVTKISRWI